MANSSWKDDDDGRVDRSATAADVLALCGTIDDAKVVEILNLSPTLEELEEAVAWTADEGEALGKDERPLGGVAAKIYEILATELDTGEND